MLNRIRFGTRLSLLSATALILLAVVGGSGMLGGKRIAAAVEEVYGQRVVPMGKLAQVQDLLHRLRGAAGTVLQSESRLTLERMNKDMAAMDSEAARLWASYAETPMSADEKALAAEFQTAFEGFRRSHREVLEQFAAGDPFTARETMAEQTIPLHERAAAALRSLTEREIDLARREFVSAMETYRSAAAGSLAVIVLGTLCLGGLTFAVIRSITAPVRDAIAVMDRLAKGNTDVQVGGTDRRDEIGDIARAVLTFKEHAIETEVLRRERIETERIAAEDRRQGRIRMADQFDAAVHGLVEDVASSARRMEEAARALQDLTRSAGENSDAVGRAADIAAGNVAAVSAAAARLTASIAAVGRRVEESAAESREAAAEAERANTLMKGLAEAAGRIGEVVGLINAVAGQTNLLALNATIEAARAGEAGKGFAVVAGEVKTLAGQTAKATEDISVQVAAIQAETAKAAEAMVQVGGMVGRLNASAAEVARDMSDQAEAGREISRCAEGAARGAVDLGQALGKAVGAVTKAGEASDEVLGTARSLSGRAEELDHAVQAFVGDIRA